MDTHSRIFHKAVATIAKQVIPAPPSSASTVSERKARREHVFDRHHGMFFSFKTTDYVSEIYFYLLDIPASLLGDIDRDIIQRVRDVVTNTTIAEIMEEEPNGPIAYRDALRQQILALCTRLRVSLVIVDQLMALSNSLAVKTDNANAKSDN